MTVVAGGKDEKDAKEARVAKSFAQGDGVSVVGTVVGSSDEQFLVKVSLHVRDTGVPTVDDLLITVDDKFVTTIVEPMKAGLKTEPPVVKKP